MNIHFEKASFNHIDTIFKWLLEPHIIEFWDNSQNHKDDIINFVEGRKKPSPYFKGMNTYWVGFSDGTPYAFMMSHYESEKTDSPQSFIPYLSKTGKTIGLDFCIGNIDYLGKGLAAPTLIAFMTYFSTVIDTDVDTYIIDPFDDNPRAIHVYQKAGFEIRDELVQQNGYFSGKRAIVMVKKMPH
jgi:RimJ/RimL family protein N-acetyltransferase